MRSYMLQLRARDNIILPVSNGYFLFSLLCALAMGSELDSVFHPKAQSGKKTVSVGMMRPRGENTFGVKDFHLLRGDIVQARVSFIHDEDGALFLLLLRPREGTPVRLGTSPFVLEKLLCPGEDELALSLTPAQLAPSLPAESVGLRFVSPTGFKRDGRQFFLPLPELIFGDLLRKWRLFLDPTGWPGFEDALIRIELRNYRIESRAARLRQDRVIRGFCGEAEFALPSAGEAGDAALSALAGLAFFTGVGYKTTQGMGEVWPFRRE